jgi:hypothetical protein
MREYGQIQSAFWQSEDAGKLSDRGKLLVSYLLTGPNTNGVGCFRLTDGYLLDDLGWLPETVTETLSELFKIGFVIRLEGVVFIPNFLRWNRIVNGNIAKARFGDWESISKGRAKALAARAMLEFCDLWSDAHRSILETVSGTVTETVSELFRNGLANPVSQVENQNPTPPHPIQPNPLSLKSENPDEFALTTPTTPAKKPGKLKASKPPSRFDEFWAAYPRKVGRKAAQKAFDKLAPNTELLTTILAALVAQAASPKWLMEPQFIPHASTWINGQRWEDAVEGIAPATPGQVAATKPREYFQAPNLDATDPEVIAGPPIDKTKTAEIIRDLGRKLRV